MPIHCSWFILIPSIRSRQTTLSPEFMHRISPTAPQIHSPKYTHWAKDIWFLFLQLRRPMRPTYENGYTNAMKVRIWIISLLLISTILWFQTNKPTFNDWIHQTAVLIKKYPISQSWTGRGFNMPQYVRRDAIIAWCTWESLISKWTIWLKKL